MAKSTRFVGLVALQLCVPAVLYLVVGFYTEGSRGIEYFLPNYFFMAMPLLLVSLLAMWPKNRGPALLWVLSLLNVLLIVFQLWILLGVNGHESSLAWILYVPLWGIALLASAIVYLVVRHKGARQSVGS